MSKVAVAATAILAALLVATAVTVRALRPPAAPAPLSDHFTLTGAVFPTSLGVNPQQTVFALSRWGSHSSPRRRGSQR